MTHGFQKLLLSITLGLWLASCSPIVDTRGHNSVAADFKQIVVKQSRDEDVLALLGSPTTRSNFGEETWYYITQKKETEGMFATQVTEQQVVAITFDRDRQVSAVTEYAKEEGKPVALVDKTTPTEGQKTTFIEQMLGNFGRFNAPGRSINPRDLGR